MPSLTATAHPDIAAAAVTIDWSDVPAMTGAGILAHLYRQYPDGSLAEVLGSPTYLSGGIALMWDTVLPLDTPICYRATSDATATVLSSCQVVTDTFTRTVSNGWGTATSGQAWSTEGGAPSDFNVTGTVGTVSVGTANASRRTLLDGSATDMDAAVNIATDVLAAGAAINVGLIGRYVDVDNHYQFRVVLNTNQTIQAQIVSRVAGVDTTLTTASAPVTHTVGVYFRVRAQVVGTTLRMKIWNPAGAEPDAWTASATNSAITAAGRYGTRSIRLSGNTTAAVVSYDNFEADGTLVVDLAGQGWLKDPAQPTNDMFLGPCPSPVCPLDVDNDNESVSFLRIGPSKFASTSGVFPIIDAARGRTVAQKRKARESSLGILSHTVAAEGRVEDILASGRNLFLQLASRYGWAHRTWSCDYISVTDVTEDRPPGPNMTWPHRAWGLPFALGRAPYVRSGRVGGNGLGVTGATYGDGTASGRTYAQRTATGNTYLDTARGENL